MNPYLLVFLGGGLGSVARYGVTVFFKNLQVTTFPWATLTANALSSLILGILLGQLAQRQDTHASLLIFLAAGFCGGFSTFSTFSAETVELLKHGAIYSALMNIGSNMLICFLAVWGGIQLSR